MKIQVTQNRFNIQKLAEAIASEYPEKTTPVEKIIDDEDIAVYYDSYGSTFDGMTLYDKGKFYIHLNTDLGNKPGSAKGRFTLAHELGHYYIDSHRIGLKKGLLEPHPSRTNQKQFNRIEREADYFASCLLMPQAKFQKDCNRKKFGIELIDFLKEEYKVSRTACAFRFADIGNHPIMIVYGENGVIGWKYCSEDFPYKYLLYDRRIPPNTVMGEYFNDNQDNLFRKEKIWGVDIFNYVKDDDVHKAFFEHCIAYKQKALSIIWE